MSPALNELPNALEATAWLITYASGFNKTHIADQPTEAQWLDQLGRFDPNIIKVGIEAHYVRSDRRRFPLQIGDLATWCAQASPPPPQCDRHVGQRAGSCSECRAERLVAGTEKFIGRSTVPQLEGKQAPMPDYLRKVIEATKRP